MTALGVCLLLVVGIVVVVVGPLLARSIGRQQHFGNGRQNASNSQRQGDFSTPAAAYLGASRMSDIASPRATATRRPREAPRQQQLSGDT